MSRPPALSRFAFVAAALLAALASDGQAIRAHQDTDPKFTAAIAKGEAALKGRRFQEALDAFKDANNAAGRKSAVAFYGTSRAYFGLGAFKSAADACADALKHVGDNAQLSSQIRNQRGLALSNLAQKSTDRVLKEGEAEFRAVLVATDAFPIVWYNLGVVLLKQERDQEGIIALQAYLESGARTPEANLARAMIENPRRAREPFAPDFAITTLTAEYLQLKDLRGKVVLLDFWGTWCAPCRAATPELLQIYRRYATREPFEMIGISSDDKADEGKWRAYIAEHKMGWPNYLDLDRKLHRLFDVGPIPTYIIVDGEGVMTFTTTGWGPTAGSRLEGEVRVAIDATKRKSKKFFQPPR
jgi:thiol-disulfide isomerase/thioredoxin